MKLRRTPPTERLVGIAMHVLLCFFIFSGQAVNAASSPLDQIPPPSASFLLILFLVGVLGAVIGALANPTQPDNIDTKPANQSLNQDHSVDTNDMIPAVKGGINES